MKNVNAFVLTFYPLILFYPYSLLSFIISASNLNNGINDFIFVFFLSLLFVIPLSIPLYFVYSKIKTNIRISELNTNKVLFSTTLLTIIIYYIIFR